ncbi:MAG: arsC [Bacteroidetes bacterium]|nr:arsC [Bacteroidota bacterium]
MAKITIYQKPTCTTCRQTMTILKEAGVDYDTVNYYIDPIPRKKLKELMAKMKVSARNLLRTKEPIYRKLRLADRELSEEALLDLLVEYPDLLQRPIVEKGNKAILARPAERIREIL